MESSELDGGGRRITDLRLFEISLVNIPANESALMESFKGVATVNNTLKQKTNTGKIKMPNEFESQLAELKTSTSKALETALAAQEAAEKVKNIDAIIADKMADVRKGLATSDDVKMLIDSAKADIQALNEKFNAGIAAQKVASDLTEFAEIKHLVQDREYAKGIDVEFEKYKFLPYLTTPINYEKTENGHLLKEFRDYSDAMVILNFVKRRSDMGYQGPHQLKYWKPFLNLAAKIDPEMEKAISASVSGSGSEWTWTAFSSEVIDRVRLLQKVAPLFREIAMPADPFKNPALTTKPAVFALNEATTANPDTIKKTTSGSRQITWTTSKAGCALPVSAESIEDTIFSVLEFLRDILAQALAESKDSVFVNGDDSSTHLDNGTATKWASDAPETFFKGIRKMAAQDSKTVATATLDDAAVLSVMKLMGKTGINIGETVFVCSVPVYYDFMGLNTLTDASRYGAAVPLTTGSVLGYRGRPLIVSDQWPTDLNASGVYDGTTTTKTSWAVVNTRGLVSGFRRQVNIASDFQVLTDQLLLVATTRYTAESVFYRPSDGGDEPVAAVGYNVTS